MSTYILKRTLLAVPTLVGASLFIFLLLRVIPGDVAYAILGEDAAVNPARVQEIRERLDLNDPLHVQYTKWIWNAVRLDFGTSFLYNKPVAYLISLKILPTLNVAVYALLVTMIVGIPLGIVSALRRDTLADYLSRAIAYAGQSVPSFWLGIMILLSLVLWINWTPPLIYIKPWKDPIGNLTQLIFPALTVGTGFAAVTARIMRSSALEVMSEDYVRTAYAKGLTWRMVILRHVMRNAMIPVVTVLGLEFASLVSGLVVTEAVFNIPGTGTLLIQSIHGHDYPIVQSMVLLISALVVLINLAVDLLYGLLDPRISYK